MATGSGRIDAISVKVKGRLHVSAVTLYLSPRRRGSLISLPVRLPSQPSLPDLVFPLVSIKPLEQLERGTQFTTILLENALSFSSSLDFGPPELSCFRHCRG